MARLATIRPPVAANGCPAASEPLIEDGLVDEVLRPLMSGKEAAVYVVRCGNELRCAKVYKEANKRSFRQAAEYQEGRKVRNSRQARAMAKGSKFGKKETEDAWPNAVRSSMTATRLPCIPVTA